jgi:hypothetical protein
MGLVSHAADEMKRPQQLAGAYDAGGSLKSCCASVIDSDDKFLAVSRRSALPWLLVECDVSYCRRCGST